MFWKKVRDTPIFFEKKVRGTPTFFPEKMTFLSPKCKKLRIEKVGKIRQRKKGGFLGGSKKSFRVLTSVKNCLII